jgi:small-conductance mechanosensitive channel
VNHSRPTTTLRIRVAVGIAYGTDTERVKTVLLAVARDNDKVLAEPPAEVRFEDFGESALAFALLCWIPNARDDLRIGSALRFEIEKALREAGIEVPFPQRDVRVKLQSS